MSLRAEQCKKVCRILDDVLANRPTERDSLIVAVQLAFEAQPEIVRCKDCKYADYMDDVKAFWCSEGGRGKTVAPNDFCSYAERREVTKC